MAVVKKCDVCGEVAVTIEEQRREGKTYRSVHTYETSFSINGEEKSMVSIDVCSHCSNPKHTLNRMSGDFAQEAAFISAMAEMMCNMGVKAVRRFNYGVS